MPNITFEIFLLILVRVSSFLVSSPIFSIKGVPRSLKIGISLIFSLILYTYLADEIIVIPGNLVEYFLLVIKESLFGLIIGFITRIIIISIQMGGQMIDFQVGFSISSTFDPIAGSTITLYGRLYYWLGLMLFFTFDGHHHLFYAIIESFELVPLTEFYTFNLDMASITAIFSGSFLIAFQIAVPIVITVFLSDIVIGLLARTVPQLNVFVLGLPLKVLVSFLTTIILLSAVSNEIIYIIQGIPEKVERVLSLFI